MSDIHGCFKKYQKMKQEIGFSKQDILYILGDVVDRGTEGMKILLDIAENENIILLRGNHDQQALFLLSNLYRLYEETSSREFAKSYERWILMEGKLR